MQVHQPPGGIREAAIAHAQWQHPLSVENTLQGRHHAYHFRAAGFYVQEVRYVASAGGARAAIARLAALVPKARVSLTRFHGVFAPNSKHRALVTPAKRGKGSNPKPSMRRKTKRRPNAALP